MALAPSRFVGKEMQGDITFLESEILKNRCPPSLRALYLLKDNAFMELSH